MTTMTRTEKLEKFGEGPWVDEPDRMLWQSEGFDCLVNRNGMGAWCGYVGLKRGHPLYEKTYMEIYDLPAGDILSVHGGLTYSEHCHGDICHPSDGQDHVWWLGFDCAHCFDLLPSGLKKGFTALGGGVYRDLAYVKAEVESLARQLKEVARG